MNDLDNEDSKKDTLVDVVFKKALKEFRQNIFSFYSSALAVSKLSCGRKWLNLDLVNPFYGEKRRKRVLIFHEGTQLGVEMHLGKIGKIF